jgi:hypothetical protein
MPTITATVHQALRYFFVGAIAATFVLVPPGQPLAPPGQTWKRQFASLIAEPARTAPYVFVLALVVGGCLIYGLHRVVIYPWFMRCIVLRVLGSETTERGWWRRHWPYGKAISGELWLEEFGSRLELGERERLAGWASESHVFYLATEIALFTLYIWPGWGEITPLVTLYIWPGWGDITPLVTLYSRPGWIEIPLLPKVGWGVFLVLLLVLVWKWDLQAASIEVNRGRWKRERMNP